MDDTSIIRKEAISSIQTFSSNGYGENTKIHSMATKETQSSYRNQPQTNLEEAFGLLDANGGSGEVDQP